MAYISLHYGPYYENGTFKHRINRITNLMNYLKQKGNSVELIPSIHVDRLEVVFGIRVAFRCRLSFLSQLNYRAFGVNHDPTLVRAIKAVEETLSRIGQVGPNVKIPGLYKEMFNIPYCFGSGILHNNDAKMIDDLKVDDDDSYTLSSGGSDCSQNEARFRPAIKFVNI